MATTKVSFSTKRGERPFFVRFCPVLFVAHSILQK